MRNRYVMLAVILAPGVLLDQWTKRWADANLGTSEHPVPVRVTAAEDGRLLGDVLQSRFGLSEAELARLDERRTRSLAVLYPRLRPNPDAERALPEVGYYYFAFHHRTLDLPPRRIPPAYRAKADFESHRDTPLAEYIAEVLPYLGDEDRAEVLAEYLYPAVYVPFDRSRPVREGDCYLLLERTVELAGDFLRLRYAENPGAAWGLFSGQSEQFRKYFFLVVSLLAISVVGTLFYRLEAHRKLPAAGFAVILSGAIGNFIDRVRFNYVVDFIDMRIFGYHWPTYNFADVAITVGVCLLLVEAVVRRDAAVPAQPAQTSHGETSHGETSHGETSHG